MECTGCTWNFDFFSADQSKLGQKGFKLLLTKFSPALKMLDKLPGGTGAMVGLGILVKENIPISCSITTQRAFTIFCKMALNPSWLMIDICMIAANKCRVLRMTLKSSFYFKNRKSSWYRETQVWRNFHQFRKCWISYQLALEQRLVWEYCSSGIFQFLAQS